MARVDAKLLQIMPKLQILLDKGNETFNNNNNNNKRKRFRLLNIPHAAIFDFMGAYHLARKSGYFGLKSNGKVIFRKFRSEIVEYLQRYSSFSVRKGTAEMSFPFAKLSSFQSLISRKQLREIEVQMVSAISFGWFAKFRKNPYHYSTLVPTSFF